MQHRGGLGLLLYLLSSRSKRGVLLLQVLCTKHVSFVQFRYKHAYRPAQNSKDNVPL